MRSLAAKGTLLLAVFCLGLSARAEAMVYWESNRGIERTNLDRSYSSDVPDFSRFTTGGFIQAHGPIAE